MKKNLLFILCFLFIFVSCNQIVQKNENKKILTLEQANIQLDLAYEESYNLLSAYDRNISIQI